MNTDDRLTRLETVLRPIGCATCKWWDERMTVICDDRGSCYRDEQCPNCGRVVPIRYRVEIVGVDLNKV